MNKEIYNRFRNIIYLFIQSSLSFYKIILNINRKIKTQEVGYVATYNR